MKLQLMREESLVINKELEPLWYGGINHVKFTGTANQMEVINLIKDTNKIRFYIPRLFLGGIPQYRY